MAANFAPNGNTESTIGLLRKLMDDIATLFRQELALAAAEFSRSLSKLVAGAVSIAIGAVVLVGAFVTLLASAVLGLAHLVSPWLAALLVGLLIGAVGTGMILAGLKSAKPATLKPTRSAESLRHDKNVLLRKGV